MQQKLFQATKGKQVKLVNDAIVYTVKYSHEIPLESSTGLKPIKDSTRGIETEILDGPYAGLCVIAARTLDIE